MDFPILSMGMPSRFAKQGETRLDCMHGKVLRGELNIADESGKGLNRDVGGSAGPGRGRKVSR